MKTNYLKISISIVLVTLILAGCKKEELEPFHAKGKIIEITSGCYLEIVLIEVENPEGIGQEGTFAYIGDEENQITYKNAIAVPYFSKIGIQSSVPQKVGTWLYFEYRELTEEEKSSSDLYSPDPPPFCYGNIIPPSAKRLIITKVLDFK
jgi:hypothetical protein